MTPVELLQLWDDISSTASGAAGLDRRLLDVEAPVSIYACVFWPGGQPGLLIEGDGDERAALGGVPKCRGVRLAYEVLRTVPARTVVRILLEDLRLREIFAVLAVDLLSVAGSGTDAPRALRRCIDRLAMWQGLFERLPADGLSEEAQRGLFGELWVFQDLVLEALPITEAVAAWIGPEPANQDFIHRGLAIEVKASLAKRHSRLAIANEKQLDERPYIKLVLAHARLDDGSAQGETLPALVQRCRGRLRDNPLAEQAFDNSLMDAGYLDVHAPLYEQRSWLVSSLRFFHVEGAFPRLTDANLPPGVGDIRYTIIADDLAPFECGREQVVDALRNPA